MVRRSRCTSFPNDFPCLVPAFHADGFARFVFGGAVNMTADLDNADDKGYTEVFLLSLPAFRWFKSSATTKVRRASNTCSIIGKRQMISTSGRLPSSQSRIGLETDPWTSGIGVFDMSQLRWQNHYDAGAEDYDSPEAVKRFYSVNYREPSWSNRSLTLIFSECCDTTKFRRSLTSYCKVYWPA